MARRSIVCVVSDSTVHAALCESRARAVEIIGRGQVAFEAPDSLLVDHDPAALTTAIADAIAQLAISPIPVTLVIPMQWCFVHVLACPASRINPESLGFELERFLPLPLEELACAFQALGTGQVLSAALPVAPMVDILESLAERGVAVDHITADVFAATHGIAGRGDSRGVVLLDTRWGRFLRRSSNSEASVGVFGRNHQGAACDAVPFHLDCERGPGGEAKGNSSDCVVLETTAGTNDTMQRQERSRQQQEAPIWIVGPEAIDLVVNGACSPSLLDLRTGALAPHRAGEHIARRAVQVLTTALVLIGLLVGGTQLRLRALRGHLEAVDQQRLEVYRQVFDADQLPPEAALRVASERVRLEGLTRRAKSPASDLPRLLPPPLEVLRSFVAALPEDVRILLNEARVDESQLLLRGQTVEHRDAERIAETMNLAPGLDARPPRTTRLKTGGVEFSIAGGPRRER